MGLTHIPDLRDVGPPPPHNRPHGSDWDGDSDHGGVQPANRLQPMGGKASRSKSVRRLSGYQVSSFRLSGFEFQVIRL